MTSEVVWPIASVLAIFLARMAELATKRKTVRGTVRENLTFRLFMLAGVLMLVGGTAEWWWHGQPSSWPLLVAGWVVALASFMIRRRAIAALGQFWSLHVEIRENHQFVKSGPFRFVRHPTYFSMILELAACGLILHAGFTMVVIALVFVPALLLRVRLEEGALTEKFGDAYRAYQKSTPAIFPYKWPAH